MQEWLPAPPKGTPICLGADGSDFDDWTAIRAETLDGLQFTPRYGPDRLPTFWDPKTWPGARTPRDQVQQAADELFSWYKVERFYFDPPRFETDIDALESRHPGHVFEWWTNRPVRMAYEHRRLLEAIDTGTARLGGLDDQLAEFNPYGDLVRHVGNAGAKELRIKDDQGAPLYVMQKQDGRADLKFDAAMAWSLAWSAAMDARKEGAKPRRRARKRVPRRIY